MAYRAAVAAFRAGSSKVLRDDSGLLLAYRSNFGGTYSICFTTEPFQWRDDLMKAARKVGILVRVSDRLEESYRIDLSMMKEFGPKYRSTQW